MLPLPSLTVAQASSLLIGYIIFACWNADVFPADTSSDTIKETK
jgi:hypothetical protein